MVEVVPHEFDDAVIAAVLRHMNDDHTDDNLLIARAFGDADAAEPTAAVMTGFDGDAGVWDVTRDGAVSALRVPWPGGPINDRPAVRREVVAVYEAACDRLGVTQRDH